MMLNPSQYWDVGIKLVSGCTKYSPGCDHCWSLAMEKRFNQGDGSVQFHPDRLNRFNKKKPTVFSIWNDLLHDKISFECIQDTLDAMCDYRCEENTFLILTKRPQRWSEYYQWRGEYVAGVCPSLVTYEVLGTYPNIYFGLTVCNQQEADEKIPIFMQVPGKKFLSIEPMLGPIDTRGLLWRYGEVPTPNGFGLVKYPLINAVILGGETGSGARPMHPDWVRSVRDQCAAAGVPFFFKQWGEWAPDCLCSTKKPHKDTPRPQPGKMGCMFRCGNKAAGRLLNGRTHDGLPWRTNVPK